MSKTVVVCKIQHFKGCGSVTIESRVELSKVPILTRSIDAFVDIEYRYPHVVIFNYKYSKY